MSVSFFLISFLFVFCIVFVRHFIPPWKLVETSLGLDKNYRNMPDLKDQGEPRGWIQLLAGGEPAAGAAHWGSPHAARSPGGHGDQIQAKALVFEKVGGSWLHADRVGLPARGRGIAVQPACRHLQIFVA